MPIAYALYPSRIKTSCGAPQTRCTSGWKSQVHDIFRAFRFSRSATTWQPLERTLSSTAITTSSSSAPQGRNRPPHRNRQVTSFHLASRVAFFRSRDFGRQSFSHTPQKRLVCLPPDSGLAKRILLHSSWWWWWWHFSGRHPRGCPGRRPDRVVETGDLTWWRGRPFCGVVGVPAVG
jgi:hypothetical protein